jgi:protein SCO1/2
MVGAVSLALVVIIWSALLWRSHAQPTLPVLFSLPVFSLIDEQGQAFGSAQLAGRPYVADFVYTACHDACPMLTARMGELQDLLRRDPGAVRLVTFTVDPEHDSPRKLAEYARAARAIPGLWSFVTGPVEQVSALLVGGFKVSVERGPELGAAGDLSHDGHLVVVDAKGRIRGYFEASPEGLVRIRSALKDLLLGA